jgi:NAD(P)-dependent dehydrogenase (short-subunit alcohol dehydrogenase family)
MASSAPIILILGAGANIGHHVARAFAAKGYRVASAARKLKNEDSTPTQLNIQSDFADPDAVAGAFAQTKAAMGLPSVVVYNGMPFHHHHHRRRRVRCG